VILLVLSHRGFVYFVENRWVNLASATSLLIFFTWFVGKIEKRELEKLPLIGRLYRK
jgi:hypothetical protein